MTALLADMAAWEISVALGGVVVAGVFGAVGIAWLGAWLGAWLLVRRSRPTPTPNREDGT
ncbi:MAG TPA: hypothetical protein VD866_08880 [Urbifossiella sp.]|nr:hypothetical protein [Urbifossiella sp.]